ncbi:MAG: TRAP transporter large permease [Desulfobacula sp.]|jgi:tripartite ATP-independent transporter DctM subunit|nr:TRAP transporter large permease [Deltaproteobacteria bacterium]MBT4874976.1 TRAP transporter large permease [Desulfobacula sp.]MBT5546593.1 TRAP transporter large permease [Desulfobacula sp.]MBT6611809.1 TRAP transporter large permease [Deltaproteobacteria bacterium]MBT7710701.1 TRAP transporter large permease [Deltaproteobacteria bacterium]
MYDHLMKTAELSLGWDFYGPLLGMVLFILLGVRIWAVIGLGSVIMLMTTDVLPATLLGEALFDGVDSFALIAVPLFILTGDVLVRSGLSNKLLDVAEATMGWQRAGLGTSTVLGCGFFACISGSDAADAAAIGRITIDRLVDKGYPKAYACALVAAGACTGILIPPSISYIIIGLVLGISASTLFLAAAIPGVLVLMSVMVTNFLVNRVMKYEDSRGQFDVKHWLKTVWDGRYALLIPFIILGGIYSGIFTPTESASVAVIATLIIGFYQKTINLSDVPKMLETSAKVSGVIVPIIAMSLPFAQTLAALEVPQYFVYVMTSMTENRYLIMLSMIAILIIAGCVMETTPNIVILAPILMPLALEIGMNDIHFCIFMVSALGIGFITPPLGLNLFVVSGVSGEPVMAISRHAIYFVFTMLAVVILIMSVPAIALWLL